MLALADKPLQLWQLARWLQRRTSLDHGSVAARLMKGRPVPGLLPSCSALDLTGAALGEQLVAQKQAEPCSAGLAWVARLWVPPDAWLLVLQGQTQHGAWECPAHLRRLPRWEAPVLRMSKGLAEAEKGEMPTH